MFIVVIKEYICLLLSFFAFAVYCIVLGFFVLMAGVIGEASPSNEFDQVL